MLLVLSAIFLLIGIQGTSLIRFSTGSNTFELERRERSVEQAAAEVARDVDELGGFGSFFRIFVNVVAVIVLCRNFDDLHHIISENGQEFVRYPVSEHGNTHVTHPQIRIASHWSSLA